jgi:SPP1 family predicted phage head-tail adaptor
MRLGNRITNPGELQTKITLLKPAASKDAGGAQKVTYSDFTSNPNVYAKVTFAHGQESVSTEAMKSVQRVTVMIRYRSDVNAACAVRLNGAAWQIIGTPDNIQNRNEYMEFAAELVKGTV